MRMDRKAMACGNVDGIRLTEYRVSIGRFSVRLLDTKSAGNFLTSWGTNHFCSRVQHHSVD